MYVHTNSRGSAVDSAPSAFAGDGTCKLKKYPKMRIITIEVGLKWDRLLLVAENPCRVGDAKTLGV